MKLSTMKNSNINNKTNSIMKNFNRKNIISSQKIIIMIYQKKKKEKVLMSRHLTHIDNQKILKKDQLKIKDKI